jgi:4-hydroxy-3-methylbut-2-enyl diphosphate reductase IspH
MDDENEATLSVADAAETILVLQQRFPTIARPRKSDICYATWNLLVGIRRVGVSARASVPESLVDGLLDNLRSILTGGPHNN